MKRKIMVWGLVLLGTMLFSVGMLWADERVWDWSDKKELANIALKVVPGDIVKVEKDYEDDIQAWEYDFTICTKKGQYYEVTVNEKTKKVVDVDGPEDCNRHRNFCHND